MYDQSEILKTDYNEWEMALYGEIFDYTKYVSVDSGPNYLPASISRLRDLHRVSAIFHVEGPQKHPCQDRPNAPDNTQLVAGAMSWTGFVLCLLIPMTRLVTAESESRYQT